MNFSKKPRIANVVALDDYISLVGEIKIVKERWGGKAKQFRKTGWSFFCFAQEDKSTRIGVSLKWASIYEYQQFYGGAEEGGWYYFTKEYISSKRVFCYRKQNHLWKPINKNFSAKMQVGMFGRYHYEGYTEWEVESTKGQHENLETQYYS
jgi:hypothetical protein